MKGFLVVAAVFALAVAAPPKARSPKPQPDGRIIGGTAIDIQSVNFQLSFLAWGSHICGAVLISPTWVVTAAHCAEAVGVNVVTFRGGSNYHATGGQVISANSSFIHSQYDSWMIDYDIAVYALNGSFGLGATVGMVALPAAGQDWAAGEPSRVSGWGTLSEGGSLSPDLQAVVVPIVGLSQCREAYGVAAVTERMLCAGISHGGQDACQGDSGGPLTVNDVLAGLVSWGYGCARPNFPGVYSHVGALRPFITNITGI